jgi:hypothetical protein
VSYLVRLDIGYLLISAYLVESPLGEASGVALQGVLVGEEYLGAVAWGMRNSGPTGV